MQTTSFHSVAQSMPAPRWIQGRGEPALETMWRQATLPLPPVPTLLATRLQLELLLGERSVDLRAAVGIILNDPGATLEIFRKAGEECGSAAGRMISPLRLEDCLASLSSDAWMEAVCGDAVERVAFAEANLHQLTRFWEHSRSLAYACWMVAERTETACPEQAYLVGLLHEAATLPALLGWEAYQPVLTVKDSIAEITQLASRWHLPPYLQAAIAMPLCPEPWAGILQIAHAMSCGSSELLQEIT